MRDEREEAKERREKGEERREKREERRGETEERRGKREKREERREESVGQYVNHEVLWTQSRALCWNACCQRKLFENGIATAGERASDVEIKKLLSWQANTWLPRTQFEARFCRNVSLCAGIEGARPRA